VHWWKLAELCTCLIYEIAVLGLAAPKFILAIMIWLVLQALEAKEGVPIKKETIPTANITFQVFFRSAA